MAAFLARKLVCLCACAFVCTVHAQTSAWDAAVAARQEFESQAAGSHTRLSYTRILDNFRAIYHSNPADVHAPRAVQQVAELLAEEGHEFNDGRLLKAADGQYEFLRKNYPQSSAAREQPADTSTFAVAAPKPTPTEVPAQEVTTSKPAASDDHYHRPTHDIPAPASLVTEDATVTRPSADSSPETEPGKSDKSDNAGKSGKIAMVTGIRHWSTPTYTRVAIDLGDEVTYQAARVEHPDRIYFDLHNSRLAHELSGKSFAITDDGFLSRIRAAQYTNDVTRVVLDVHEVTEYSAFLLPNPYRLIIDIHGKQPENTDSAPDDAVTKAVPPATQPAPQSEPAAPITRANPETQEVSSLPPMSVTDGSAGFGLGPKQGSTAATVAPPRVVISSRPTAQKPVPNTTVSKSAETPTEVAAVSSQPGRVVATSRPTSAPIAERSGKHVAGEPVAPAPPTAEGETSLMRALGLKIGRIVIDAGHGGHDSGTLGAGGIEEKDVVLDVALRLGKLLHDRLGAEIVYTRADDTFIPLETRTAIANKAQADLFISVHANSSQDETARGVEVYYLNFTSDPDAMRVAGRENAVSTQSVHELSDLVKKIALKDKIDESKELASDVDDSLYAGLEKGNQGLKNRGVKKAPFVVLIGANMPSILAEISFVTNPKDAAQLRTPEYRERVAESLFKGVQRYAEAINGTKPRKSSRTTEQAAR